MHKRSRVVPSALLTRSLLPLLPSVSSGLAPPAILCFDAFGSVGLWSGAPLIESRSGIAGFFQSHRAAGASAIKLQPIERFASDATAKADVLYTRGTYTYLTKDGQTKEHGNYLCVFNQEGGRYKIAYLTLSGDIKGSS